MASPQKRMTSETAKTRRARLRAQGLRPIQLWVPDTRSPAFAKEARRQSRLVALNPGEPEDQAFIDAISIEADEAR
jgi:Protein  of unknown function (DUF3018)